MRRPPAFLLILAVIALAVVACSSSAAPGWTYAPAASAAPAASGGVASGEPSAAASGEPSAAASEPAAGSPVPSATAQPLPSSSGGAATTITIKAPVGAATSGFDPATAETTAGSAFTLTFDNEDNQAPHNLILNNPDGSPVAVQGDTAFFTGPGTREYQVPALTAGDYQYICQVHPTTMLGTLTVK